MVVVGILHQVATSRKAVSEPIYWTTLAVLYNKRLPSHFSKHCGSIWRLFSGNFQSALNKSPSTDLLPAQTAATVVAGGVAVAAVLQRSESHEQYVILSVMRGKRMVR